MSLQFGRRPPARHRLHLTGRIAHALDFAALHPPSTEVAADLLAYLALILQEIVTSVEASASAWERRGYWLKSDRFRREWRWAEQALQSASDSLSRRANPHEALRSLAHLSPPSYGPRPRGPRDRHPWGGATRAWRAKAERPPGSQRVSARESGA